MEHSVECIVYTTDVEIHLKTSVVWMTYMFGGVVPRSMPGIYQRFHSVCFLDLSGDALLDSVWYC